MLRRTDTDALKRARPIADVVAERGIALRPSGRALVGRCPFHADGGKPNLHVYPGSASFYCYRCAAGGDAIAFVMRLEGLGFRAAVERLSVGQPARAFAPRSRPLPMRRRPPPLGREERACLAAATELYANRLHAEPAALAYLAGRGVDPAAVERHRIGFAAGHELADYLRWRGLPLGAAVRVGLLHRDGREHLAGRVVVPEVRGGQPVWLIGRALGGGEPTYLGLPGPKPLLGWEAVEGGRAVWVVEGVFDWLTLRRWDFPAVALTGTRVRPEAVAALGRFERVYLALDGDEAGRAATNELVRALGSRAVPVPLPGVADPAELALAPAGRAAVERAAARAELAPAA